MPPHSEHSGASATEDEANGSLVCASGSVRRKAPLSPASPVVAYSAPRNFDASQRKMFEAIERVPGIKLRLGYVVERTPSWHHAVQRAIKACGWDVAEFQKHFRFEPVLQQKGVDSLITLDLVYMAEHTGYEWAVLIAGDRDLEEAVWTAQEEGRKVLLAVPKGAGVAPQLRRTADEVIELDTATLERFLPARQNRS